MLVTHESFGAIGVSSAEMASVVREELEVMKAALVAAKGEGANRSTVRELEKARYRLRDKLKELKDRIAGVTGDLMRAMIKRAHPLGMLTSRERRAFLRTLTPEEKRSLDRAIAWWRETYVGGHKLTQRD